ncbi:MAG: hypothetical protein OEY03_14100 [Rhizobacter sp.]|nr:hypothetical protein [Rhizobacter sp.]
MVLKKKSTAALATVTWVLILGGMLSLALGLVVRRSDADLGLTMAILSGIAIAVGIVLVWVRSRMPDDEVR